MPKIQQPSGEILRIIAKAEASNKAIHISDRGKVSIASPWRQFFVELKSRYSGTDYRQISHLSAKEFFISQLQEETEADGLNGDQNWKTLKERVQALTWKPDSGKAFNTLEVIDQLNQEYTKIKVEEKTKTAAERLQRLAKEGIPVEKVESPKSAITPVPGTSFKTELATTVFYHLDSNSGNKFYMSLLDDIQATPAFRKKIAVQYDRLLERTLLQIEKAHLDDPSSGSTIEVPPHVHSAILAEAINRARVGKNA